PLTGDLTDTLPLGGSDVLGMARAGSLLWVLTSDAKLRAVDLSGVQMAVVSTVTLPRVGRTLTVADGVAWITAGIGGTMAVDVSLLAAPKPLSDADQVSRLANGIALNGSGLGVVAGAGVFSGTSYSGSVAVIRVDNPSVTPPIF